MDIKSTSAPLHADLFLHHNYKVKYFIVWLTKRTVIKFIFLEKNNLKFLVCKNKQYLIFKTIIIL